LSKRLGVLSPENIADDERILNEMKKMRLSAKLRAPVSPDDLYERWKKEGLQRVHDALIGIIKIKETKVRELEECYLPP